VDGSFERVTQIRGGTGAATAVAGGIEYARDPMWTGTGRLEFRRESTLERWLASAGFARKLNRDWSALGRTTWMMVPDEQRVDTRSQVGLAWRQTDGNRWNGLARYENKLERTGGPVTYRKVANIASVHANLQPRRALVLSGQLAAKWAHDDQLGLATHSVAQLAAGRATVDLGRSLDVGVAARGLASGSNEFGLGAELGLIVMKNLRLAAGYNVFGFRDIDLAGTERTDRGPYLNLGLKVDESWFGHSAPEGGRR
jgi:hypothetical protein